LASNCWGGFGGRDGPVGGVNPDGSHEEEGFQALVAGQSFDDALGVGDTQVRIVEIVTQDLGAEPAIGLERAQVIEEAVHGGVSGGAGAIDGGLGGGRGAIFGFGDGAAVEAPGGAHDLDGQQFLDGADGAEVFPKSFGEVVVFADFFGPDTVLSGEEAELEVIARGTGLTFGGDRTGRSGGIEAIGFDLW